LHIGVVVPQGASCLGLLRRERLPGGFAGGTRGVLLRCQLDATALLAHPILPPEFAVRQVVYLELDTRTRAQEFVLLQRANSLTDLT
jgi:hypothetical protein